MSDEVKGEQEPVREDAHIDGAEKGPAADATATEAVPGDQEAQDGDGKHKPKKEKHHPDQERIELEKRMHEFEAKNKAFEEEVSSLKDMYLRKQADFENFRKRMTREKEEYAKYANSGLLLDLITIIDDFERAIKAAKDAVENDSLVSGIELIETQLVSMLEKNWSLKRIHAKDEPFNPEIHEAVAMEQSEAYTSQVVIEEYLKGYMLHDRVIRHAKVKVGVPLPKSAESGSGESV